MNRQEELKIRQRRLKKEVSGKLDLLIGHIRQSPAMKSPTMTFKVHGKTVTRSVRKHLLDRAREMTANHLEVRELIKELAEVNWELLNLEEPRK